MARSYTIVRSWRDAKLWYTKCVKRLFLVRGFDAILIGAFTNPLELEATIYNVANAYAKYDNCVSVCLRVSRADDARAIANYDIVFEED